MNMNTAAMTVPNTTRPVALAALSLAHGQADHDGGDGEHQGRHAGVVQTLAGGLGTDSREGQHERQNRKPDRNVQQEDPAPAEVVGDETAQERPGDRGNAGCQACVCFKPASPLGRKEVRGGRETAGRDEAAADALQEA